MKNNHKLVLFIALISIFTISAWALGNGREHKPLPSASLLNEDILGNGTAAIVPIPENLDLDPMKIALGKKLFNDTRISGNGFSCSTCHPVERAGMDGLKVAITTDSGVGVKNTPTIFNSGFNAMQHWNGEIESLEKQIVDVIQKPGQMNTSWQLVISVLQSDPDYTRQFNLSYDNGITTDNIINSLATYERSLYTPNSNFDKYLRGDFYAITPEQKKGYQLFQQHGCITCHQGINVGGNMFAKFGIFSHRQLELKDASTYEPGRFLYTKSEKDRSVFRVPGLRNSEHTAPYFHDGSAQTLFDAIKIMGSIQLDIELPEQEIKFIEKFLHSLSGEYQGKSL